MSNQLLASSSAPPKYYFSECVLKTSPHAALVVAGLYFVNSRQECLGAAEVLPERYLSV
jgi:hypothetical protein